MKEQIQEAQRNIIENLARWENTVAELYGKYAELLPEMQNLWAAMAREERSHAAMFNTLLKPLAEGHLFFNVGDFEWDAIEEEIAAILRALHEANTVAVTPQSALLHAIKIESSMMESKFYSQAVSEAPAFKQVAAALNKATRQHFERLQKQLAALAAPAAGATEPGKHP